MAWITHEKESDHIILVGKYMENGIMRVRGMIGMIIHVSLTCGMYNIQKGVEVLSQGRTQKQVATNEAKEMLFR